MVQLVARNRNSPAIELYFLAGTKQIRVIYYVVSLLARLIIFRAMRDAALLAFFSW